MREREKEREIERKRERPRKRLRDRDTDKDKDRKSEKERDREIDRLEGTRPDDSELALAIRDETRFAFCPHDLGSGTESVATFLSPQTRQRWQQ